MKTLEFKVRKLHVSTDIDKRLQKRQASRVYVNEEALIELTGSKDGGRAICIERAGSSASSSSSAAPDESPCKREATLWKAPEKLDKSVTQMYDVFRETCGYKLGEHIKITALGGALPDADEVVLQEVVAEQQDSAARPPAEPISPQDLSYWEFFLAGRLSLVEHVHGGLALKNLFFRGPERTFSVASVNGSPLGNGRYVDRKTTVRIKQAATAEDAAGESSTTTGSKELKVPGIPGLQPQIDKLNSLLDYFNPNPRLGRDVANPNIVIHGGRGTGKTMLLNRLAATGWGKVFRIQFKDKLTEIQEVFQRARLQQPSIILLDEFERLIDKERNNRGAVILAIGEALDSLAAEAEEKGEAPRVAVVAACLDYTTDVPEELKRPSRFTDEVYLPLPDVASRREILASFNLHLDPNREEAVLRQLSERTHAYNGSDLKRLFKKARHIGYVRDRAEAPSEVDRELDGDGEHAGEDAETAEQPKPTHYTPEDYYQALKLVRPSAMHDINLKPPPIRWDDIGGQGAVKKSLRRAVRLSNERPEKMKRFFDRPPKGFLLYGPPGCSKTMAAQAMATESGLNFFAVKGAELLNTYVGESERAVRRLFQRAREVAPSMIFFDEIDSIGGQRHGFGNGGNEPRMSGGLNVLTTLLNEMDGFEALQGVVVLAATNRPQAIDPALLRPGRFDELIYVPPPDEEARRAICTGMAAKRGVDPDVDIDALVRQTEGYSGAEIVGIWTPRV